MRYILFIVFVYFPSIGYSAYVPGEYWDECPGPACPSNIPNEPTTDSELKRESWDRERIDEREQEIIDREIDLFEREMRTHDREL